MPRNETDIQRAIIEAIEYYFTDPQYGHEISRADIVINTPASGGQAKDIEDFGRKPYDVGFFAMDTIAIFLEVKERQSSGKIPEFKEDQLAMLETLSKNGVDIRYAYNAWDFDFNLRLSQEEVLEEAHVRAAQDMGKNIKISPIHPAQTLLDYLDQSSGSGGQTLVDVLSKNKNHVNNFNSMPLMILANLDPQDNNVLIDRAPSGALKVMKEMFDVPDVDRKAALDALMRNKNKKKLVPVAQAIFKMKDSWVNSKKAKIKP